jgi:hypothetical protein
MVVHVCFTGLFIVLLNSKISPFYVLTSRYSSLEQTHTCPSWFVPMLNSDISGFNIQRDRQRDRQSVRQTDRQTDRDRQTDGRTDGRTDRQKTNKQRNNFMQHGSSWGANVQEIPRPYGTESSMLCLQEPAKKTASPTTIKITVHYPTLGLVLMFTNSHDDDIKYMEQDGTGLMQISRYPIPQSFPCTWRSIIPTIWSNINWLLETDIEMNLYL